MVVWPSRAPTGFSNGAPCHAPIPSAPRHLRQSRRDQSVSTVMAVFFLLLVGWFGCGARAVVRTRAKVVEDYVVSAKFNENRNLPQLGEKSRSREIYHDDVTKDATPAQHRYRDDLEDANTLEERDLLVHHHHLPPHPPPVPPPPPPPVGLAYAPSLFAIGLIVFLGLLNSLQTSLLLLLKPKGSVLGAVTGALGRRRRSAPANEDVFPENIAKSKPISARMRMSFAETPGNPFPYPYYIK